MGLEDPQGFLEILQRTADDLPVLRVRADVADVQEGVDRPFDQQALRMIGQCLGECLEAGTGGLMQSRRGGGGEAQRYLEMVPERVFLGTAPTTVSTFWPPLKTISVGMLRIPYWLATLGFSSVLSL
jgi:hypothetical protein